MIRKTEVIYKNHNWTWLKKNKKIYREKTVVKIQRITWWFLFVPIYRQEKILEYIM